MSWDIAHDAMHRRFETTVESEHCTLDYELDGDTMIITHVRVPDPVSGRGIAAALTEAALAHARSAGWRVIPQCPYAVDYVHKHPGWSDVLAPF
jgi:predicted GNAT family acetyltransferase